MPDDVGEIKTKDQSEGSTNQKVHSKIPALVAELLCIESTQVDAKHILQDDLEMDSVEVMQLIQNVEEDSCVEFDTSMEEKVTARGATVQDFIDLMSDNVGEIKTKDQSEGSTNQKVHFKIIALVAEQFCTESTQIKELSAAMPQIYFEPSQTTIRQGDLGDTMYFLEEGTCDAFINGESGKHYERFGDFFVELALVTNEPRKATVKAGDEGAYVALVTRSTFDRMSLPTKEYKM